MDGLDRWDMALLAGAVIAATWKLMALMAVRRNRIVAQVQQQIDQQRELQKQQADEAAQNESAA
ncbi:hypothetical protein Pla123a_05730 [Posidoniimonas polymericola]|uniref:Uncharacterized protein n=1 Tax=Posidoniimonas polymericola TaxID=2528002 RepID=A0A5C5ZF12_9BACT|nr:hypothetical protein [Posidoniimonas polymericola]TWT85766.1 hypothetical protein Pla123a_05730 [Posidoniimonas polymericola]